VRTLSTHGCRIGVSNMAKSEDSMEYILPMSTVSGTVNKMMCTGATPHLSCKTCFIHLRRIVVDYCLFHIWDY